MSFFRTAVIVSAGIALMPSDEAQQEALYKRVSYAAHWTATFCDRNEATCENASSAWDVFVRKAEFAGRVAFDVVQTYASGPGEADPPPALSRASTGTLRAEDLEPAWRGRGVAQGI